jgi:hypothetical protein
MSSLSADGGAKTKKKKKKIRKDDATPSISVTENPPTDAVAPPKRRVKVKKSTDDAKSPRSSNKSNSTTSNNITVVNNKASHSDEAAQAVVSSTRRHAHASGSTASDDSGGGGDANSLNVPTVDSSKKKSRKSIAAAIDGSSSSAGSFSVKRHVKKVFGFGSFLSGTRSSKADDEQRADPSIDMGVVNEMLDALGDNNSGTAAAAAAARGGNNVTTAASRSSPFRDTNGPFSSASSQVDDNDDDLPASLQRRTSSARYQLLRQRSQVVNQQYEGAKRQLQRLVSDSSMRSSDPDELAAESPPLSPTSDTSGSPTKGITMPPQQRSVVKRSSSVSIESPSRIRRQPRQAILAPTRVAPTPVVVPPIVTRRSAPGDDVPPPQYTLAPPSSNAATPSSSARPARDATTAAFLACMYEVSQMREKINVTASAADAHAREASQELAQEQSNNAAQLREVDSKLDKSETSLRTVRDSIQKLENRIQVVKRAQRNANVALKAGQLLPVLGLMALFVYCLRLLINSGSSD